MLEPWGIAAKLRRGGVKNKVLSWHCRGQIAAAWWIVIKLWLDRGVNVTRLWLR
jgi:hypothetical protein